MKAKSNSPSTWTTFEEAVEASANFDGVGWCVPLDGPVHYWGFDADDAVDPDTGEFKTWENAPVQPQDLLELASYAEITPSKDRKSTRLNSSHLGISYAVFCL